MRILKVILVWVSACALAWTLYNFGLVKCYCTYRYETYRFESLAEVRTILIIFVLTGAGVISIQILSASKTDVRSQ